MLVCVKESEVVRIRFASEQDELKGYYLLATEASVRSLRGGLYEITQPRLGLPDQHSIKYVVIPPAEVNPDEAEAIRNSLTVKL